VSYINNTNHIKSQYKHANAHESQPRPQSCPRAGESGNLIERVVEMVWPHPQLLDAFDAF